MSWSAIAGFRLVSADPARLVVFYEALGFASRPAEPIARTEMRLLGLNGTGERRALRLGPGGIDLDTFDEGGSPYPADVAAADLIFQHLALVTDDAATAWRRAQLAGATPISRDAPVTLPQSSGGVTAIKFRDPEGHPLEFLQFPAGANQDWPGQGIMGIDHSAIVVSDVGASLAFYREHGLTVGEPTLNQGPTQVTLDGLPDVRVDVAPLKPATKPPHLELLAYRQPPGRRHDQLAVNDVAATRIVWRADRETLVRDPDGHLHQLMR